LLNAVAISVLTSFSFQRFPDGEPVALFFGRWRSTEEMKEIEE